MWLPEFVMWLPEFVTWLPQICHVVARICHVVARIFFPSMFVIPCSEFDIPLVPCPFPRPALEFIPESYSLDLLSLPPMLAHLLFCRGQGTKIAFVPIN